MAEIGKNVIENLTDAMYENSLTIYREYIQNSADAIDKALEIGLFDDENDAYIDITIDQSKRVIKIYDNACGIEKDKFLKILTDIADSTKDKTANKGFRGIGRLAGVAYCSKLIFRSSCFGEDTVSELEWNGKLLKEILSDDKQHPSASDLVDTITEHRTEKCDADEHYFEVVLCDVIPESDNLLNEEIVISYLQAVAPVPYVNSFILRKKIYDFAAENNFLIDEYAVNVNGNQIFKPYTTKIYEGTKENKKVVDEITDLAFEIFKTKDGHVLGWLWYGISTFEKQISSLNEMRGIRLRKGNIQIGDENAISYPKFYKEPRGVYYFFGELFAVHNDLIPNARRDYFKTNATQKTFELSLRPFFHKDLEKIYRFASNVKKAAQAKVDYVNQKNEYNDKISTGSFVSKEDKEREKTKLSESQKKADSAEHKLELRKKDTESNPVLDKIYKEINNKYKPENKEKPVDELVQNGNKVIKYRSQSLSRFSKKEQKLIGKIYEIIKSILPEDLSESVIKKIEEELK